MSVCQSCDYDDNDEQIEEEQGEDTGALPREGQAVATVNHRIHKSSKPLKAPVFYTFSNSIQ